MIVIYALMTHFARTYSNVYELNVAVKTIINTFDYGTENKVPQKCFFIITLKSANSNKYF